MGLESGQMVMIEENSPFSLLFVFLQEYINVQPV